MGEVQTIKWLKDKRTKRQTMIYNTLPRKLRIDNEFEILTPLFVCFKALNIGDIGSPEYYHYT